MDFPGDVSEFDVRSGVAKATQNVRVQPRLMGAILGATAQVRKRKVSINQVDTGPVR